MTAVPSGSTLSVVVVFVSSPLADLTVITAPTVSTSSGFCGAFTATSTLWVPVSVVCTAPVVRLEYG